MRAILLAVSLVAATPAVALADGFWEGCDENHDGTSDCNQDNDGDGANDCTCDAGHPPSGRIAGSLFILGALVYGISRRRRR
jgi:hypothetical protein